MDTNHVVDVMFGSRSMLTDDEVTPIEVDPNDPIF
jgi:hypothetical protein